MQTMTSITQESEGLVVLRKRVVSGLQHQYDIAGVRTLSLPVLQVLRRSGVHHHAHQRAAVRRNLHQTSRKVDREMPVQRDLSGGDQDILGHDLVSG